MIRNRMRSNQERLKGGLVVASNAAIRKTESGAEDARHVKRFESRFLSEHVSEDQTLIRKDIERDRQILDASDPGQISKRQRTAMEKKALKDREWLQKHMCPKSLFYVKSDSPDFERAKDACLVEHTPQYNRIAHAYKQAMRMLAPDDPKASNLENIRPQ